MTPPRQPCAPPAPGSDAAVAFGVDLYDCPCGHMYGDHEYSYSTSALATDMVIGRCYRCDPPAKPEAPNAPR